eukprot:scaffold31153_cov94-Isochrysis_galbana.AAC.1
MHCFSSFVDERIKAEEGSAVERRAEQRGVTRNPKLPQGGTILQCCSVELFAALKIGVRGRRRPARSHVEPAHASFSCSHRKGAEWTAQRNPRR